MLYLFSQFKISDKGIGEIIKTCVAEKRLIMNNKTDSIDKTQNLKPFDNSYFFMKIFFISEKK